MNNKENHWTTNQYKDNYDKIKGSLEEFSSELLEFLHYETKGISEKGLRHLLSMVGRMRQTVYSNSRKNRDLFFSASDAIQNVFKPALKHLRKR